MDVTKLGYRPCVGIMAVNRLGQIWIGRRILGRRSKEGAGFEQWWQMPQGGIDAGEEPEAAAVRELAEETGMHSVAVLGRTRDWHHYDLPNTLVPKTWGGRFRGQRQLWFALRFEGDENEIDIGAKSGHAAEFDAWRWAGRGELLDLIVPFKRAVYTDVLAELGRYVAPS